MSLFSAIANEGAPPIRGFWSRGMRMIVTAAVVASVIGVVVVNIGQPEPTSTASLIPRSLSSQVQAAFGNAPALEGAAPAAGTVGAAVDPFIEANTTALDWLVPPVGQSSTRGDAFIEANTTALDWLVPPVGQSSTRGDAFIEANTTDLEYPAAPYTERWNGPR